MGDGPASISLAILILLAGCSGIFTSPDSGPTPIPTETQTATQSLRPTDSPTAGTVQIQHDGDDLPVDPVLVWQRVQSLHGTSVEPPERVVVRSPGPFRHEYPRFYRLLTACGTQTFNRSAGGFVRSPDTVHLLISSNTSEATIEAILAHEYAHVIQFRTNALRNTSSDIRLALLQGGAVYVEKSYIQTYLNESALSTNQGAPSFQTAAPCEKKVYSQNYFGYRYIASRIDSPRNLDEVYSNPPKTTEQLIHNLTAEAESPLPLEPEVRISDESEWLLVGKATEGELMVRSILWTELNDSQVNVAATGWGNDRLLTFWNGSAYGYVWILRWDDTADAAEFRNTLERFLSKRGPLTGEDRASDSAVSRIKRISTDKVAVFAGEVELVNSANVTMDGGTYELKLVKFRTS